MYCSLAVLLFAALWLIRRLYVLAKIPVAQLVKTLNIDIPRSSKISVDNITSDKVYVHWELYGPETRIVCFSLYLNDQQVATLNGQDSHCCLSNLKQNTKYKLDLISVNAKGYKAKSTPVYIKTKPTTLQQYPNNILLENPQQLFKLLTDNSDVSTVHKLNNIPTPGALEGKSVRSRSNTATSLNATANHFTTGFLPDPKSMEDIEELRYHLEAGQEELHTILDLQSQALSYFKEQETILIEERDKLRDRKKLEDGNRQSMKTEIKMLDDSRRLTEIKRSKQESLLNSRKKAIEKMERDLETWEVKIKEFEKHKFELDASEDRLHDELDTDLSKTEDQIKLLHKEISRFDEEIKSINQQKKQKEQIVPQFTKCLKILQDHTDNAGCIDNEAIKALETLRALSSDFYINIKTEVDLDAKLEAEWRAQQQKEVNHCLKVSQAFEKIKDANIKLIEGSFTCDPTNGTPPAINQAQVVPNQLSNFPLQKSSNFQFAMSMGSISQSFSSNNSFSGFPTESTNSLNTLQQPQQQHATNNWNLFQASRARSDSLNSLQLNTNIQSSGSIDGEDIESPSVDHFLPTDLINEELPEYIPSRSGIVPILTETVATDIVPTNNSDNDNTNDNDNDNNHDYDNDNNNDNDYDYDISNGNNNTSNNGKNGSGIILINPFGIGNGFNNNPNNDSATNISSRSIFHNDFNISSNPRYSLEAASSPTQSFHNELLTRSNQASPTGGINNDIISILSGGGGGATSKNNILGTAIFSNPVPEEMAKESSSSSFSPKKLSTVFNFRKNKNNESSDQTPSAPSTTSSQLGVFSKPTKDSHSHSKFFHKNGHVISETGASDSSDSIFKTAQNGPFNTLDNVWQSSNIHNRTASSGSGSHLEKDTKSWLKFHNETDDLSLNGRLEKPNTNISIQPEDSNDVVDFGEAMNRSHTEKSSITESLKSLGDSANTGTSPSFFRKKSFFPFGSNNQSSNHILERTSSRHNGSTFNNSPEVIIDGGSDIEDYTPIPQNSTPKRLFSINRKLNRKQSMSSGNELESSYLTDSSAQSSSTTNSKSIVKRLSFFGKNNVSHKEIDDIHEQAGEDLEDNIE